MELPIQQLLNTKSLKQKVLLKEYNFFTEVNGLRKYRIDLVNSIVERNEIQWESMNCWVIQLRMTNLGIWCILWCSLDYVKVSLFTKEGWGTDQGDGYEYLFFYQRVREPEGLRWYPFLTLTTCHWNLSFE